MLADIEVPEITRSQVIPVFITNNKTSQNFRTNERNEIVTFKVTYIPMNNDSGKKLLPEVKKIVDSVLKNDFTPSVATINTFRNGDLEKTTTVNDCIVKSGRIELDKDDFIRIIFELSGILYEEY
jgi:hypothetical protein